jgi:hypothetical protein
VREASGAHLVDFRVEERRVPTPMLRQALYSDEGRKLEKRGGGSEWRATKEREGGGGDALHGVEEGGRAWSMVGPGRGGARLGCAGV